MIIKLDAVQRLAFESKMSCACLGNAQTGEFELLPLGGEIPEGIALKLRLGTYIFAGVLGYCDGVISHQEESIGGFAAWRLINSARPAYREYVIAQLQTVTVDDSAAWLEKLHALEDPRK